MMYYDAKKDDYFTRDEFLQRLYTEDEEELGILFDILDSYANSMDCYARGLEINGCDYGDGTIMDGFDDDGLYYMADSDDYPYYEVFTGVWSETFGDTRQYLVSDERLPEIVAKFEEATGRK